jgi:hypothetical protein
MRVDFAWEYTSDRLGQGSLGGVITTLDKDGDDEARKKVR